MKNAIIVHGKPDKDEYYSTEYPSMSNFHWLPWLQKQLLVHDIAAATPEIPHSYLPEYELWKKEFERFDITPETVLVGHSCGGGFLIRWLSEHQQITVNKVVLVAPWLDPENELKNGFFDFIIDPKVTLRTSGITIFSSNNDFESIQASVQVLRNTIEGIKHVQFQEYGHFTLEDMKTVEFPELVEEILQSV